MTQVSGPTEDQWEEEDWVQDKNMLNIYYKHSWPGMVLQISILSTLKVEAGGCLSEANLVYTEIPGNQNYIERPCLRKQQ